MGQMIDDDSLSRLQGLEIDSSILLLGSTVDRAL